ncbi:MAG: hypothetical protein HY072_07490 [Deltaproteobacteria bacterium]|nr:hypothetical protein [Deltaproteobacteria bacterium]
MQNMQNQSKLIKDTISAVILLAFISGGCTKSRTPHLSNEDAEITFDKTTFESQITLSTTDQKSKTTTQNHYKLDGENEEFLTKTIDVNETLKPLFKDFFLGGKPDTEYKIKLELDKKFVTAFKVTIDIDSLSALEKQLIKDKNGEYRIPVFKFSIKAYGVLVPTQNEYEENTWKLKLKETTWEQATHIQISPRSSDRLSIQLDNTDQDEIFLKDNVNQQVLKSSELAFLNIKLDLDDNAVLYTQLDPNHLNLYQVLSINELSAHERSLLAHGSQEVTECSQEVLGKISEKHPSLYAMLKQNKCVLVLKRQVSVTDTQARLRQDANGIETQELIFTEEQAVTSSNLIRIHKNPVVKFLDSSNQPNPSLLIKVSQLKTKEFLFRRTLQDSPNSFSYVFPGLSGALELVRFQFLLQSVKIVRSEPLTKVSASSPVDHESMMILPVKYFKKITQDANGIKLSRANFIQTNYSDPEAYAEIQWTQNKMPNTSSPLDYYSLEKFCFEGPTDKELLSMNEELEKGLLHFTIEYQYQTNRNEEVDCSGIYQSDYFSRTQTAFSFRERFAFREYNSENDKSILNIPYEAQKRLGFGVFTYNKSTPNKYGNTGIQSTEIPLPTIYDIRNGRQVEYVLSGLPKDHEMRSAIIKATQDVIADLNKGFRQALAGTPQERKTDVITLTVDGEELGEIGDLNKNYIHFIGKNNQSHIIGLGGPDGNPKSGVIESGAVYIYGGNILAYVEHLRKRDREHNEYKKNMIISEEKEHSSKTNWPNEYEFENGSYSDQQTQLAMLGPKSVQATIEGFGIRGIKQDKIDLQTREEINTSFTLNTNQQIFHEAMQKTLAQNALTHQNAFEKNILESQIKRANSEHKRILKTKLYRLNAMMNLREKTSQAKKCLLEGAELPGTTGSLDKLSDLEVFVSIYKPTLLHELLHNVGLRHNFMGSYDKANWKFSEKEKTNRDYSSIMDYLKNDHNTYDGAGPQDVASLRAAYTGYVQLSDQFINAIIGKSKQQIKTLNRKDDNKTIPVLDGKWIQIDDFKNLIGLKSWFDLSESETSILKKYRFCSDEEAEEHPLCHRFDEGSTPLEIVQGYIDDYQTNYSLRNFPNDKASFELWDYSDYLQRIVGIFLPIRMFLEETIYASNTKFSSPQTPQANGEEKTQNISLNVDAVLRGLVFFHSIIRTPDLFHYDADSTRFYSLGVSPSPGAIETKSLHDILLDDQGERLAIRGIEFDKVIAMIVLCNTNFGFKRYENFESSISYPYFEKANNIFIGDKQSPDRLLTVSLLKEILTKNITPAVLVPMELASKIGGYFLPLKLKVDNKDTDFGFSAQTTQLMQVYALMNGLIELRAQTDNKDTALDKLFQL